MEERFADMDDVAEFYVDQCDDEVLVASIRQGKTTSEEIGAAFAAEVLRVLGLAHLNDVEKKHEDRIRRVREAIIPIVDHVGPFIAADIEKVAERVVKALYGSVDEP